MTTRKDMARARNGILSLKTTAALTLIFLLFFVFLESSGLSSINEVTTDIAVASMSYQKGPRAQNLLVKFYSDETSAYTALKLDEIDIMDWPLTAVQYLDAISDPNIILAPFTGLDVYRFDFNNNFTIGTYSTTRNPLNLKEFRQALAHMVDKNSIVDSICGGLADIIDVPIPHSLSDWWNASTVGSDYPYQYSPALANAVLDAIDFVDRDGNGIRNYPLGWTGGGSPPRDVDPLVFYAQTDDLERYQAGQCFFGNMSACGLQVDFRVRSASECQQMVMNEKDYHIYVGGERVGRDPPPYLYFMFHSTLWCSRNYVTGTDETGLPNYPALDEALHNAYYAANVTAAQLHCRNAQGLLVDECVSIWLWSSRSFYAYRNLLGVCNMNGQGPLNYYTYLNAYKPSSPTGSIRIGSGVPTSLNIIYYRNDYDYSCLDKIYDTLLAVAPHDTRVKQPLLARDWDVGSWYDPNASEVKTVLTFWLRNATWHDGGVFSPFDVGFTIDYLIDHNDARNYIAVMDIHHWSVSLNRIDVYMNLTSIWALDQIGSLPIIPKHTFMGLGNASGYYAGMMPLDTLPEIEYSLNQSLVGTGMYVLSDHVAGSGGYISFGCNQQCFWQTPVLGEVDFYWVWVGATKPRRGSFRINIFDVVKIASAFGSSGKGKPSPSWLPEADVSWSPGTIDIFDIVVATGRYMQESPVDEPEVKDSDHDGNTDKFEDKVNKLVTELRGLNNDQINKALDAANAMNKKNDVYDEGVNTNKGETVKKCDDTGEIRLGSMHVESDPELDVKKTIVHESRHALQLKCLGDVIPGGKRKGKPDLRTNDKDGDLLPDDTTCCPELNGIKDNDPTTPADNGVSRLEDDAKAFEDLVKSNSQIWIPSILVGQEEGRDAYQILSTMLKLSGRSITELSPE